MSKRLSQNKSANVEADIVAELNLSHIFKIIGAEHDLLAQFGVSAEEWATQSKAINELRKRVAHSAKPVLESNDDFGRLVEVDHRIHALVGRLAGDGTAGQWL